MRFTRVTNQIFNREKKRMQKSWASKRLDRDDFQYARQEIADQTADRILDVKRAFYHVLELGADQGEISWAFSKIFQFLERILLELIHPTCSLYSRLIFFSIFFFRNRFRNRDIREKLRPHQWFQVKSAQESVQMPSPT